MEIQESNAAKIAEWFRTRGGILVWDNADLGFDRGDTITPMVDANGQPVGKPAWWCGQARAITSPEEIVVIRKKEVARFPVAVRLRGSFQHKLVLTDGSARKLAKAKSRFPGSWHEFDFLSQEAILFVEAGREPLI